MGVKLALIPQDIDALEFRDRDYLDVEHLARALTAWAEQADAAGATAQATAFRDIREILVKPIRTRAVGEVEVQVET